MPTLLEASDVDLEAEALDLVLASDEEAKESANFYPQGTIGDLSDGGQVGAATLYPTSNGKRVAKGRATARRAWTWNGTETLLPLAWNPEGTRHDGGRHYLRKRHCLCCGASGFFGVCTVCIRNNCSSCRVGTDKKKIIPLNYLREQDVPFPQKFYGSVDCFHPLCPRKGERGFKNDEEMRLHASGTHRMEYQVRQESLAERKNTEADDLRKQVAELRALVLSNGIQTGQVASVVNKPKATRKRRKQSEPTIQ